MGNRLDLHEILVDTLGSEHVYYQPPASISMKYPAIKYNKSDILMYRANNTNYHNTTCYELIVISKTPDHPAIDALLTLPYTSYGRHYVADNLHHDTITIYY